MINHYTAKLPSLELGWLMRHEKGLPIPRVIYAEGLSVGGYYIDPSSELQLIEGIEVPPGNGTLIVCDYGDDMPIAGTIAHELRHHWQKWNGWKFDSEGWASQSGRNYRDAIINYFMSSVSEMDALLYELKFATCYESEWRLAACRESNMKD